MPWAVWRPWELRMRCVDIVCIFLSFDGEMVGTQMRVLVGGKETSLAARGSVKLAASGKAEELAACSFILLLIHPFAQVKAAGAAGHYGAAHKKKRPLCLLLHQSAISGPKGREGAVAPLWANQDAKTTNGSGELL